MRDLVNKKGILVEPLIKPEREKPSLYRQARTDLDRKMSRVSRTGGRRRRRR